MIKQLENKKYEIHPKFFDNENIYNVLCIYDIDTVYELFNHYIKKKKDRLDILEKQSRKHRF